MISPSTAAEPAVVGAIPAQRKELKMTDIIDMIRREMNDYADAEKLLRIYECASPYQQAVINEVLMTICGWTLPTLKRMVAEPGYEGGSDSNFEQRTAPNFLIEQIAAESKSRRLEILGEDGMNDFRDALAVFDDYDNITKI
jgi:hypothetical protein